ncbi:MAG: urease accessory protein UreH [Acidobacteria bacterium]|nr:urease accessory protein UreH [Acidobacteriota bacterium]
MMIGLSLPAYVAAGAPPLKGSTGRADRLAVAGEWRRYPHSIIMAGGILNQVSRTMDAAGWATLGIGLLYGVRHSLDADHVVAISTIVTEQKSLRKSSLIGAFWGVGHTTSLLIAGLAVIGLRTTIPDRLALSMEFLVALMLIGLGLSVLLRRSPRLTVHTHEHDHGAGQHAHVHLHVLEKDRHQHTHLLKFGRKPFLIGLVHGMAGSAALTLLVLSTISSMKLALVYILIFGAGSIAGMLAMSNLISLPFLLTSGRLGIWNHRLQVAAGISSVAFGAFLAWDIIFVQRLIGE